MQINEPFSFEKDLNTELLYWVVRNEQLRRYTGQPYRLFTYRNTGIMEVNLNIMLHEYLQKFVIDKHEFFFEGLLPIIEPIIYQVMAKHRIKELAVSFEFYLLSRTYRKNVSYVFSTKTL